MANITFRLNKGKVITDEKLPQKIYLRYRLGRKIDFNASLKYTVLKDDWDFDNERVKNRSHILNKNSINNHISNLIEHFRKFDNKNLENGYTPSYSEVKEFFDSFFVISVDTKEYDLFSYFDQFLIDIKTQTNEITGSTLANQTITSYRLTKTVLKDFNDTVYKIDFDKITIKWYHDFIEWNYSKNRSKNYVGKHIKNLKSFLNIAVKNGITSNVEYKESGFKVLREESDSIALTMEELTSLWNLDLSLNQVYETTRDLFLIGAFTGLRISDFNTLTTEKNIKSVNGVKILKVKTEKTGRVVAIPLHPIVDSILQKNNGIPPKRLPDKTINESLKIIAKKGGIKTVEYLNQSKGGKKLTIKKFKYQLVTSHTARRSFCTNAYLLGMSSLDIMSISGHTTESSFLKYIKVTPEQVAIKMSEHPYFKNATSLKIV